MNVHRERLLAFMGTFNFEREFTLRWMHSKDVTLSQIEKALQRINDGTFGMCEECGARIPETRLNPIPYATRCLKCASQR